MSTLRVNGKLRLKEISRIDGFEEDNFNSPSLSISTLPISKGLGIEYEYQPKTYIVIAFIYYNEQGHNCYFESVGSRVQENISIDLYPSFLNLLNEGFRLVTLCNNVERVNENRF